MKKTQFYIFLNISLIFLIICCGGGGGGGSDGGGQCELVASEANATSFLEVDNVLNIGIEWYLPDYAFGAFLRPGECTLFGLRSNRQFELTVTRCTSAGDVDCPNNGIERIIDFSVADGETYAIVVNEDFF